MTAIERLFVDCETAGTLEEPIVYNLGAHMLDGEDPINVIMNETFFDHDLMNTAYYANKRPIYVDQLWDSEIFAEDFWAVRAKICEKVKAANGRIQIYAHNAAFDVRALNNTCRVLSGGKVKYFFPYGTEICDTLKMARQVLGNMPTYRKFCEENGYMTKHKTPRPRFTAEVIYRFITKDPDFAEAHRGLEDVLIEQEIYRYIMRQHKKCDKVLYPGKKG